MTNYAPVPGTQDIFPEYHKYLTFLKKVFRHELRKNWFWRISNPLFQSLEMMEQVLPDSIDDLEKSQSGVLRNNPNIATLRAYVDSNEAEKIQPVYHYYMESFIKRGLDDAANEVNMFWGEILGESDPILDAISLYITYITLNKIGLSKTFEIRVNTSGIEKEKVKYKEELISFYENKKHLLTPESQEKLEKNPILLLASEEEDEKILASQAPIMTKFLKKDSKAHHAKFLEYLDVLEIPYTQDHTLIGDFHYNTQSLWELRTLEGIQISKGARSNDLWKHMWIPKEVPSFGFYTNTKVVVEMLQAKNIKIKNKDKIDLFFVQLGDEAKKSVLSLSLEAREAGINTVVSLGTPSMKEQMLKAQRSEAKFVVMVWVMEARSGVYQVRDSVAGTQEEVNKDELIEYIIAKIGDDRLDFYCPANDLIEG